MHRTHWNTLQKMNKKRLLTILIIGLIIAGVFIKLYYVNYTDTWQRQHDVISFGADEGHAAYIEYILNNKKLPDFDPREKWGFFQPPLHHIISAKTMEISKSLGMDDKRCEENTQVVTCIYMLLLMLFTALIFVKVKGNKLFSTKSVTEGFAVVAAIVFVHPLFTLLSGSINNDALALILSLIALYISFKWFEKPGWILTILLALTIGLAMFAKLTGGLVAVPIGIQMVRKILGFDGGLTGGKNIKINLWDRIKFFLKNYLVKMIVFAVVVFPVGLYWSIRNKILWDMPVNYIPPVGENFPENITLSSRIFDIGTKSAYTSLVSRGDSFDEYNVPLLILKTSLFSESSFADVSRWMKPVTWVMFILAAVLSIIALVATLYMTFSKKSWLNAKNRILLFGTWGIYLFAYLGFAITHRNFSAGDFRYAAICIVIEGIFTGLYVDTIKNKKVKYAITAVAVMFAICSFGTYALLGFKS